MGSTKSLVLFIYVQFHQYNSTYLKHQNNLFENIVPKRCDVLKFFIIVHSKYMKFLRTVAILKSYEMTTVPANSTYVSQNAGNMKPLVWHVIK